MLTADQVEAQSHPPVRRKRPPLSLEHQYREYLMQRIDDYKNSLSRDELIRLGDDAARELLAAAGGQLPITEVLMLDTVDQQIMRRLHLPSFRKWRSKILPLREAQRDPTHWQMERADPVAVVLPRLEPGDRAVVVGGGAERAVYLLAAHEIEVCGVFEDTATAVKVEGILAGESLSGRCEVFVAMLGTWLPAIEPPVHLVVMDAAVVLPLPAERQRHLVQSVQEITAPEGVHALVTSRPEVAPEGCLRHYPDWQRIPGPAGSGRPSRNGLWGVLLGGPPVRALSPQQLSRTAG